MSPRLSRIVESANRLGERHAEFALAMFWQFAVVVAALALLDVLLLRRRRAALRYGVWSLGLLKLLLPVTLLGPLGYFGWLDALPRSQPVVDAGPAPASGVRPPAMTPSPVLPDDVGAAGPQQQLVSNVANREPPEPVAAVSTSVPPGTRADPAAPVHWPAVWLASWCLIALGLTAVLVRRMQLVHQLVAAASPAPPRLVAILRELNPAILREPRPAVILVCDSLKSPAICGFLRARILIPRSLVDRLDDDQIRLVLVHELSHWRRLDPHINGLQSILQIVYFYNPLVWVMNAVVRRLREHAVDEAVLVELGAPIRRYGEMLLDIADLSDRLPGRPLPMTGILPSRNALSARIRRMVARPLPRRARLGATGFAAVIVAGFVLLPLAAREPAILADDPPAAVPKPDEPSAPMAPPAGVDEPVAVDPAVTEAVKNVAPDEIAGFVIDEQGRPIEGALVDAWSWYPGNETRTDAKGVFRLKGFDSKDPVEVFVTKDGYSPAHFPERPTGHSWGVVLTDKTYFEGTITGADGRPAAGATIHASFDMLQQGTPIGKIFTKETSREDGTFRLYVTEFNSYEIQVSAPGQGVARLQGLMLPRGEQKPLDVTLNKGARFEAQVVDSVVGAPVQGFVLWQWQGSKLVGKSDANGRIVFEDLIPGPMEFSCGGGEGEVQGDGLRFYHHGPFGRWWSAEAVHEHQKWQIDDPQSHWQRNFDDLTFNVAVDMPPVKIVVEPGVTVSGHVTDPNGQPVEGATVAPARTGSGNSLTGDTRYSVKTDKDGAYHVVLPASNDATT